MTGQEHYLEGERLVAVLTDPSVADMTIGDLQVTIAAAQVHATLALVRATLASATEPLVRGADYNKWDEVPS